MESRAKDMAELRALVEQLQYPRNNLLVVLSAATFIDDEVIRRMERVAECKYQFKDYGEVVIHPDDIAKTLKDKTARGKVMLSAIWMGIRDIGCEPFELVKDFSKHRQLFDSLMTKQSWYRYAKVVRNSLRHNKKLDLKEHGTVSDVIWGSRKIPAAAHGKPLTFEHFGPGDWFVLHTEIVKFALSLPAKAKD
ncbi:MAG: hypothetical protein V1492_05650 [Candidatus Micrarchaeota archaeon]